MPVYCMLEVPSIRSIFLLLILLGTLLSFGESVDLRRGRLGVSGHLGEVPCRGRSGEGDPGAWAGRLQGCRSRRGTYCCQRHLSSREGAGTTHDSPASIVGNRSASLLRFPASSVLYDTSEQGKDNITIPKLRDLERILYATIGMKYNPSSSWTHPEIPRSYYRTIVEFNNAVVFDQPGVSFSDSLLPDALIVRENLRKLRVRVFLRPNGTSDSSRWILLLSNDPSAPAAVRPGEVRIYYRAPEHYDGFGYVWEITPRKNTERFGPIVLKQQTGSGENDYSPVRADVTCENCAELGVTCRLIQVDDFNWELLMEANLKKVRPSIDGKQCDIIIDMVGKGGAVNVSVVVIDVVVVKQ